MSPECPECFFQLCLGKCPTRKIEISKLWNAVCSILGIKKITLNIFLGSYLSVTVYIHWSRNLFALCWKQAQLLCYSFRLNQHGGQLIYYRYLLRKWEIFAEKEINNKSISADNIAKPVLVWNFLQLLLGFHHFLSYSILNQHDVLVIKDWTATCITLIEIKITCTLFHRKVQSWLSWLDSSV